MNFELLREKRVLVTGGTGFVGRHLLPLLTKAGARVTCLARVSSRTDHLPAGVKVAWADLQTGVGLAQALSGQDIVIHLAVLLFGLGWQDYLGANSRAAAILANALAREERVERAVLVSSLAVAGPCAIGPGIAEDALPMPVSAYGWSKLLVEQTLSAPRELDGKLVILRPPIIYGSGDKGLLPVFRGAAKGIAVSPGVFREFPVSVAHAHDVARAVLCCCAPEAGGVYHLNDGVEHTMSDFCRVMGLALYRLTGRPAAGRVRVLYLPLPVMAVTAALATGLARLVACFTNFSSAPNWNMDKYREARQAGWLADAGRIRRELDWKPEITLQDGLEEAVEGYRREGLLL
ncbi:MAG: NAD(P)-dependent oxidoreductase [Desulfovibrio sp.]|jgi:nucleoside-diphosphate-sugar epimerase|nr:NAD(P)-dependent oxidoreductase [Desulfovibrio sp.]